MGRRDPNAGRGYPPVSDDERAGVDNGACGSFTPDPDAPIRCRSCGYLQGSHR